MHACIVTVIKISFEAEQETLSITGASRVLQMKHARASKQMRSTKHLVACFILCVLDELHVSECSVFMGHWSEWEGGMDGMWVTFHFRRPIRT